MEAVVAAAGGGSRQRRQGRRRCVPEVAMYGGDGKVRGNTVVLPPIVPFAVGDHRCPHTGCGKGQLGSY